MTEDIRPRSLLQGGPGPFDSSRGRLHAWTPNEVLRPLLEPILHPSRWRIRALGLSTMVGHPLFYICWALWLPQPYEHLGLRILMSVLGLSLLIFPGLISDFIALTLLLLPRPAFSEPLPARGFGNVVDGQFRRER